VNKMTALALMKLRDIDQHCFTKHAERFLGTTERGSERGSGGGFESASNPGSSRKGSGGSVDGYAYDINGGNDNNITAATNIRSSGDTPHSPASTTTCNTSSDSAAASYANGNHGGTSTASSSTSSNNGNKTTMIRRRSSFGKASGDATYQKPTDASASEVYVTSPVFENFNSNSSFNSPANSTSNSVSNSTKEEGVTNYGHNSYHNDGYDKNDDDRTDSMRSFGNGGIAAGGAAAVPQLVDAVPQFDDPFSGFDDMSTGSRAAPEEPMTIALPRYDEVDADIAAASLRMAVPPATPATPATPAISRSVYNEDSDHESKMAVPQMLPPRAGSAPSTHKQHTPALPLHPASRTATTSEVETENSLTTTAAGAGARIIGLGSDGGAASDPVHVPGTAVGSQAVGVPPTHLKKTALTATKASAGSAFGGWKPSSGKQDLA
jgi:hypothetical protein